MKKHTANKSKAAAKKIVSDTSGFSANWKNRKEALSNHWTPGEPKNQIQLAFRKHWELFREILGDQKGGKCLEIGCGRGTISSYFANAGYDCTLLDYSAEALDLARKIFNKSGFKAKFIRGDANRLPFKNNSFDVVVSIGLLEHFADVGKPLREQVRVLKPGGVCLAYIVPERPQNVQKYFRWLNFILKTVAELFPAQAKQAAKSAVYRNDGDSKRYLSELSGQPVAGVEAFGMYPLPMISHSPEFPFSLLPAPLEFGLSRIFNGVLTLRHLVLGGNPWRCDEKMGQAFLVTFRKKHARQK